MTLLHLWIIYSDISLDISNFYRPHIYSLTLVNDLSAGELKNRRWTYNSLNERDQYIQFLETLQFLCNFRSEQISWNIHFDEVQTLPSITKSLFEYRSPNTSCGIGSYRLRMDAKCIKLLSSAAVNVGNRASAGKFSEVSILGNKPSMR